MGPVSIRRVTVSTAGHAGMYAIQENHVQREHACHGPDPGSINGGGSMR